MATTIGEFLIDIGFGGEPEKELTKIEKDAKKAAEEAEKAFREAAGKIGDSFKAVGKALAGAFSAAGVGIFALVDKTTEAAAAVDDLSKKTGISTDSLQKLSFVAQRGGVSIETMTAGLTKLARNLDEARQGGAEPFKDALERIGLTTADLGKGAETDLGTIADALNGVTDETARTALTMEILGKGGVELGTVLAGGSAEIEKFTARAEELGLVMSGEDIEASAQFQDELDDLKNTIGAVARDIGMEMMPAVKELVVSFREWITANKGLLAQKIEAAFQDIARILKDLIPLVADLLGLAVKLTDALGGPTGLAVALGATKVGVTSLSAAMTLGKGGFIGMGAAAGALGIALIGAGAIMAKTNALIQDLHKNTEIWRQDVARGIGGFGELSDTELDESIKRLEGQAKAGGRFAKRKGSNEVYDGLVAERERRTKATLARGQEGVDTANMIARNAGQHQRKERAAKGSGARKEVETEFDAGVFEFDESHGAEIRSLAERYGVTDVGIDAALKAGAESLAAGSNAAVAREAALSRLGSLAGADLTKPVSTDPLSQLLGVDALPNVPLNEITQEKSPQVLMATINNNFTISNSFDIDGAGQPNIVADHVVEKFRDLMENDLQRTSKYTKVVFAR